MGEYGTGKITDWENFNPHHLKRTKFPEEQVCALCDTVADTIFPIVGMVLCLKCGSEVKERKDILLSMKPYVRLNKSTFCARCGKTVYWGVAVNTRICHKCTVKAGVFEKQHVKPKYGRRVL